MPEVQMPRLSDTMQEGVLSRWLKQEGEQIHKGDVIAEVETDKATMELEAYDEGPLTALLVTEGTTVPIGEAIAIIGEDTRSVTTPPAQDAPVTPPDPRPASPTEAASRSAVAMRATPLVRKLAREHGIDLGTVTGTGPRGRIVRADIEPVVASRPDDPDATSALATVLPATQPDDDEVPLSAIRRVTARRLTESAAVPHFYLTSVVDAERLLAFRAEVNAALAGTGADRISVTDLLVRACAVALQAHPQMNSSWAGGKILRHRRIHVGVAVATDDGLIVPVVRDADQKTLREIAEETRALAERAHAGSLTPQEFSGGTFTISNLGMYGIDHFTAIINPPEAAILAVGAATPSAVVRDDEVVVRSMIKLTLSVDHRVVDGAPAAAFLRDLRDVLQEPLRILA